MVSKCFVFCINNLTFQTSISLLPQELILIFLHVILLKEIQTPKYKLFKIESDAYLLYLRLVDINGK